MLPYKEAFFICNTAYSTLDHSIENIPLLESVNRILAVDYFCTTDYPPFNNSSMDGIAVRFSAGITEWKLEAEVTAGHFREVEVTDELAVYITTGAKLPTGFDTVIPVEDIVLQNGRAILRNHALVTAGQNIRHLGADMKKGNLLCSKGTKILPRHISAFAAEGITTVSVFRKMKIALLATGDELVEITATPAEGEIRATNMYALQTAISFAGHHVENYGLVRDDMQNIGKHIERLLLVGFDMIITTGGVSMGKYDFVRAAYIGNGVQELFWRSAIKPGKPIFTGLYRGNDRNCMVIGLPGNPVSCQVCFQVFLLPLLTHAPGEAELYYTNAIIDADMQKSDLKTHFLWGSFYSEGKNINVRPFAKQISGNNMQFSQADCLIIFPDEKEELKKGEWVQCIPM